MAPRRLLPHESPLPPEGPEPPPTEDEVESFRSASEADGGWGATWVRLKPAETPGA